MPERPKVPELPKVRVDDVAKLAKDAIYVTVGLSVIAFQKVQVQRQEFRKQLKGQVDDARAQFSSITKLVDERVKLVEERLEGVEGRFEALLDQLEERLPEQAKEIAQQARAAAKEARTQVRSLVRAS